MDNLLERLQERDWRLTPQRRAVVQALAGDNVHLSADEVLDRVRDLRPDTSRATVYNTLNELVELGEVGELRVGRARKYDPNVTDRHHHLLCQQCGLVRDLHLDDVDEPATPSEVHGFELHRVEMVFSGRCGTCAAD